MSLSEFEGGQNYQHAKPLEAFHDAWSLGIRLGYQAFLRGQKELDPALIAGVFFDGGINYLATCGDPYLRKVGREAKEALLNKRVSFVHAKEEDLEEESINLNAKSIDFQFFVKPEGKVLYEGGLVVATSAFAYDALNNPIKALTETTEVVSRIRDFTNSVTFSRASHISSSRRAEATAAHFLHHAIERDRGTLDYALERYGFLLTRYRNGIDSLKGGRYRVVQGNVKFN